MALERSHRRSSRASHGGQHVQVVLGVVGDGKGIQVVLPALLHGVRDDSAQVGWQNMGYLKWDLRRGANWTRRLSEPSVSLRMTPTGWEC